MDGYFKYIIDFNRKYRKFRSEIDIVDPPVIAITVIVFAKDITEAMQLAWKTVTVSPEDYEIERIYKDGCNYEN